jgi:hypothetical protein
MTDLETRRFEEANQAGQRMLIRGAEGPPPPPRPLDIGGNGHGIR